MAQEEWRTVEGWPYEVSSLGRVRRSGRACATRPRFLLKAWPNPQGYMRVGLRRGGERQQKFFVHRLVAFAFHGTPQSGQVPNHKNGIKADNRAENLEWVTPRENNLHAYEVGLMGRGQAHGMALLREAEVLEIRRRYAEERCSQQSLADEYGVSQALVSQIIRRKVWRHI